jgi:hypothetical protein
MASKAALFRKFSLNLRSLEPSGNSASGKVKVGGPLYFFKRKPKTCRFRAGEKRQ